MKTPLLVAAIVLAFAYPACDAKAQAQAPARVDAFAIPETDEGLPGAGPVRRYDWFQDLWKSRRSAWARQVDADRGAVVFLGDSITQGWGDQLPTAFPGLKVANRGISGDTSRGVLIRLGPDVIALEPAAVVLLIGTNDLEENASVGDVATNVELILEGLRRSDPDLPVFLCEVFPSSAQMSRPANKIQEINRLYRRLASAHPEVHLIETWAPFADESGNAKEEEFPDLLHPNELGYRKWADILRPSLSGLEQH